MSLGDGGFPLVIAPSNGSVNIGSTQQYAATYSGTDYTNDSRTIWAVCDMLAGHTTTASTYATITNTPGAKGLVTGVSERSTYVSASVVVGAFVIGYGETPLIVTGPTLIVVTPANVSVEKGTTQQFMATGTYPDSTTRDITQSVIWTSSDHAVATIT